jgi:uncharacterized SAM-binding protein YcdF (DUF218 family)
MFYYASKIIWLLVTPSNLLVSLILLGLICATFKRLRRIGNGIVLAFTLAIIAFGLLPVANYITVPLEARFAPFRDDGRPIDGIILLGGAVDQRLVLETGIFGVNDAGERILETIRLAHRYPGARILVCGVIEAPATASFLKDIGIHPTRIIVEDRSRTTYENAVFAREVAAPKEGERWLLVTSAWHMPRAVGTFEKAGFPVVPYPVDFRTAGRLKDQSAFTSVSDGLGQLDYGTKEWVGLVAYYLTGRSAALLPGS